MSRKAKSFNKDHRDHHSFRKDKFQEDHNAHTDFNNYKKIKQAIKLIPRSINQEDYITDLLDPEISILFATGPAGTGKTMLAVVAGVKMLHEGEISKIVITRPAVGVDDEKHGFLPGDLNKKMEPWTRPIFDVLYEYYTTNQVKAMLEDQIIEISPLAFMRGRTFKNSLVIADEMQNATPAQMKMLLTRLGENSRMIVTGDVRQADRHDSENGLLDFDKLLNRYGDAEYISWCQFDHQDIARHPAVAEVLKIYGDE